jgi:hypothetical protein
MFKVSTERTLTNTSLNSHTSLSLAEAGIKESTDQKAEIKIHAHEETVDEFWEGMIEIRYDSDIVRAATKRFAKKLGSVGRFHVVSWQQK